MHVYMCIIYIYIYIYLKLFLLPIAIAFVRMHFLAHIPVSDIHITYSLDGVLTYTYIILKW